MEGARAPIGFVGAGTIAKLVNETMALGSAREMGAPLPLVEAMARTYHAAGVQLEKVR